MLAPLQNQFQILEEKRVQFLRDLTERGAEEISFHPGAGVWSMMDVCHHLLLSEQYTLQYMRKKIQGFEPDLSVGLIQKIKFFLFDVGVRIPTRWKIPSQKVAPGFPGEFPALVKNWDLLRSDLERFLEQLNPGMLRFPIYKHPIAGRLNIRQTLRFLDGHFAHHMWQIKRIEKEYRKRGEPSAKAG